jgi:prepilin peptidase CpaA
MENLVESTLLQYVLLVLLGMAALTDFRTYTIPNWLTGPAIIIGLGLHTLLAQLSGLIFSLEGAAVGFGLFIIIYAFGWMGAGDVKLFAAVGSFLGPAQTISAALLVALVGGLLSFVILGFYLGWRRMGLWIWSHLQTLLLTRSLQVSTPVGGASPKVPYALAIGLGTIGSYWWYPLG